MVPETFRTRTASEAPAWLVGNCTTKSEAFAGCGQSHPLASPMSLVDLSGDGVVQPRPEIHKEGDAGKCEDAQVRDVLSGNALNNLVVDHLVNRSLGSGVVPVIGHRFTWELPQVDLDPVPVETKTIVGESITRAQDGCRGTILGQLDGVSADAAHHPENDRSPIWSKPREVSGFCPHGRA
jgi:hypothetical protein